MNERPFGCARTQGVSGYSLFQPTRALFRQASKQGIPPHRSRDIWDSWAKVDLQACKNEAGNAANVPLLHDLQHGAPRRKQVRILGTHAGDKRTQRINELRGGRVR